MVGFLPLTAVVAIRMQLAHEVREVSRERGRNQVGESDPQLARKR
jgi:hypothetical protein